MPVDLNLLTEVQQFLYDEAALLDERRYHEWVELFTEDAHYWMPTRRTVKIKNVDREWAQPHEQSYFDDDKSMLKMRIAKLDTGYSWSEDPPSRSRHMVTNVRILERGTDSEVKVESYFLVYRTRVATDQDLWVGRREDVLRKADGQWKITDRKVFLDQVVLMSKNLSTFF